MSIYETRDTGFNSKLHERLVVYLLLAMPGFRAAGQFYEYGQDAGTIQWNQFSSQNYRLIYPRGLDSLAMGFADKLEYFYPYQARVLDHEHSKMPVIIHNESSFSNGVFVWAPKRVEIFTNPNPNGYPQDWLTQLALHEGRHAFQVDKLNQGFSRALSFIAGEQGLGLAAGLLPVWYLEGDAVDAETRFSYTGRGRLPSFEMGMKAILLEREPYSYSKAFLGSYKDFIPNHYELGYLLVRYGRRTYGDAFWTDFEDYAARKPFLLSPTFFSLPKYGVKSKKQCYLSALDTYRTHWKQQLKQRPLKPVRTWSDTTHRYFTNYHFPQWISDTHLVVLRTGLDQIPEFVTLSPSGEEERIFRPGFMNSGRFSYRDSLLVWDELIPDIRWSNRNYSMLRVFSMRSGKVWSLGSGTRYYAPSLSGKGTRIAAVEQRTDHTFNVTILDIRGNVLDVIPSPEGRYIQQPAWMENDSGLILTVNDQEGEYLYSYTFRDSTWRSLYH